MKIPGQSWNASVNERLNQGYKGKKTIRKDAVRMCEALFTSDNVFFSKLSDEQERAFFNECYDFAVRRYGEENIISAVVHKDERTPYLHLDFIPLTEDGRLSAKEVIGGKKELQQLQDDFFAEIGKKWGLERGNRADLDDPDQRPRKHLTTAELKEKTARERAEKVDREASQKEEKLEILKQQVSEYINYLPPQSSEKIVNKCKKILNQFDERNKLPFVSKSTAYEAIQAVTKQANIAISELDKAEKTIYSLRKINFDAQKTNKKLGNDNELLRGENAELRRKISIAQRRENVAQRLGLSEAVSAEVQREAEEERSRQKERNKYRHYDISR